MKAKILLSIPFLLAAFSVNSQTMLQNNVYHVKPLISVNDSTAVKFMARRNSDGRDVAVAWGYLQSVFGGGGSGITNLQEALNGGSVGTVGTDIILQKTGSGGLLKGELNLTNEGAQLTTGNAKVIVGPTELELQALSNSMEMTNTETTFIKPVVGVVAEEEDQFPVLGQVNELIGGFVPYTDAAGPVNLGGFDLTTEGNINAYAGVFTGSPGTQPFIKYQQSPTVFGNFFAELTASRIWNIEDKNGTFAFLEDIDNAVEGYLPLSGTNSGSPVTGDIEIKNTIDNPAIWKIFRTDGLDVEGGLKIDDEDTPRLYKLKTDGTTQFFVDNYVAISSTVPDSPGLKGVQEFVNDGGDRKIYPQTGWVRDYVTLENAIKQDGTAIVVGDFSISRILSSDVKNFINFDSDTDQTNINGKLGVNISASSGAISLSGTVNLPNSTASTIPGLDASKNLVSLPTTTYPTLTELSYVKGVTGAIQPQLNAKAPLASPVLTGTPTAPTQSANDNSTKIASTAYTDAKVADFINDGATTIAPSQNIVFDNLALKAPINNASHTGTFTLPNGSLVITSGASTDVLLGTGAATPVGPLVRAQTINGDTSTGALLATNTVIPRAIWELNRGISSMTSYVAKTANYTLTATDYCIDLTANSATLTLPTAVGVSGKQYVIKNSGLATILTLATTSSQTIDGTTTKTFNTQYSGCRVISDGANWKIIGTY